jgi:type I restriction enzyme S subunit
MSGSIGEPGSLGNYAEVGESDVPSFLNQRVGRFLPKSNLNRGFLKYLLQSKLFTEPLLIDVTGTAQFNISPGQVGNIRAPLPDGTTQERIAAFLDRETAKIDRLMEVRRKQVERLQEQRTAVIHHAVTKGLDPNAKMKPSGVDWLGDVPEHWEVKAIKWALRSRASSNAAIKNTASDCEEDGLFPAFSASGQDVWLPVAMFDVPGIVLSAVGARCGKTFRADGKWAVVANTHLLFARTGQDRDFWWHVTNLENWWETSGSAQPFVQVARTLNRKWPHPPLTEQLGIVAHIDRETAKLDTLAAKYRRELELLAEYRASLISHAVTGKIDVRGLVPSVTEGSP